MCPWCQAEVTEPRFPCRSCGRRPKDHVSYARLAAQAQPAPAPPAAAEAMVHEADPAPHAFAPQPAADVGMELDFGAVGGAAPDVPDLAIAPRRDPAPAAPAGLPHLDLPPAAPPAAKAAPRRAVAAPVASSFDDGIDMGDGAAIDLASGPEDAVPEWARPAAAGPVSAGPSSAAAPPASLPKPVSTLLESDDGGRASAEALGAYGPVPAEAWKAPVYAYRVKMRQLELRRILDGKRTELAKAQAVVDDALVALAERGRKQIVGNVMYTKLLGDVTVAEAALGERDSALAAETEAHKKKTSGLDERISLHEAELAGARAEERSYAAGFERVDSIRQRAEAKLKRVEIELRGAVGRAGAASADDPEVLARTAERDARAAELTQAMPAATEAMQRLTAARRKLSEGEQKILAVKNERALLEDQFRKRGATHGAQVEEAQKVVRSALAALGRNMVNDTTTFGADWNEARIEVAAKDKLTASRDDEVLLHVMALDVHDRGAVQKGILMSLGAFLLLSLVLVIPIAITMLGTKPPPPPAAATTTVDPND